MNYLISEQQSDKITNIILNFFEENLTPYDGWESPKEYRHDLERDGELFLFLVDSRGSGEDDHMWYSACDNPNLEEPLPEGHCPVLGLSTSTYGRLDGYFGNIWKPFFKNWFEEKTKLKVVKVEKI